MFLHINKITKSKCLVQGNHTKCHQDSRCKEAGYVCSKKPLVSERAIAAYRKAVEGTTVFKNAEDYVLVIFYYSNGEIFSAISGSVLWLVKKFSLTMINQHFQKKKGKKKNLNTYCAASIMEMGLWWNGGQRLGKGWEVIYSWLVNKMHSSLMLLRNLFFFLT